MTGRIVVRVVGLDEEAKAATLRRVTAALTGAGFPKVEPPKPPRPDLRVVRGGGQQ